MTRDARGSVSTAARHAELVVELPPDALELDNRAILLADPHGRWPSRKSETTPCGASSSAPGCRNAPAATPARI